MFVLHAYRLWAAISALGDARYHALSHAVRTLHGGSKLQGSARELHLLGYRSLASRSHQDPITLSTLFATVLKFTSSCPTIILPVTLLHRAAESPIRKHRVQEIVTSITGLY